MYTSQYYTNPEIDERLLQGYYDDAVAAGFTGSKEDFHRAIIQSRKISEGVSSIDSLNSIADLGTYLYTGSDWKGLVNVNFDASNKVSQVALSSSTPSYDNDSLAWLSGKPCVMVRTYTNGAWSNWSKSGIDVVNDLVTGGTEKALSAEQGKMLYRSLIQLSLRIESIIGGEIGELVPSKKIMADGTYQNANTASNRTLVADVSSIIGKDVTIGGILFAKTPVFDYCWWAIHDENGNVLTKSDTSGSTTAYFEGVVITIPEGAKTLYVQGSAIEGSILPKAEVYPYIRDIIDEHSEKLGRIDEELITKGDNIVEQPNDTLHRFISNATGTWNTTNITPVASYIFNVSAGDRYEVQANPNKPAYVHPLTEVDITTTPQYMEETEKTVIPAGEKAIIDIPQDGYMLIISEFYSTGHGDYTPSSINKLESIKEIVIDNKEMLDSISYAPIKSTLLSFKKITSDGAIESATTASNRTLKVDVTELIGQTLYLSGILFTKTSSYNYCWYVFQDADGNVVEKSNTSTNTTQRYIDKPVVVPEEAVYLYIQGVSTANSIMPTAKAPINFVVESLVNGDSGTTEKTTRTFKLDFSNLQQNVGRVLTNSSYTNNGCKHTPDYIKVHKTIRIKNLQNMTINCRVYFYDKDLAWMQDVAYSDTENGLTEIVVDNIPSGAEWFRLSFGVDNTNYPNRVIYPRFEVDIESEWGYGVETTKESYVAYQPFLYSVITNMPIQISEHSYTTKSIFGYDEGLIHLPPTYTPNGKPTPLIFYIHGDAERYSIGERVFSGHINMQQCWSDAGFAQVDLDLIPSWLGNPTLQLTGGSRDDLECLSAAWQWIINHYNIDTTGFYLIGRSRGGQAVFEILGKGGATKLPIIAAISMAGANSIFEYSVFSPATEAEWQLWANTHGLPTEGRPSWGESSVYSSNRSFLKDPNIYNFVSSNFDLWSKKALTGWGLITKNEDGITPRNYFDNFIYPYVQNNNAWTQAIETFFQHMLDTMEAKSPIPLRLDWCYGDTVQSKEYFVSEQHSYSTVFAEILLSTPASLVEYRRWPGVDAENPYGETNPHYAENMIFYDGDLVLPNGAVTHNPSKVTMEWLIWCMGKDPRYQGISYELPWQ